jgi:hypothetical protein
MNDITSHILQMPVTRKSLNAGYQWVATHSYTNERGQPLYWRIRLKHPETGDKWIRPIYYDGKNYQIGSPPFHGPKPLYNLDNLIARTDEPVFICEGENCVDALSQLGLLATTSGGASSAGNVDWQVLSGRTVLCWPDNDECGAKYIKTVTDKLKALKCTIKIIDVSQLNLSEKQDVVDWLAAHPEATKQTIQSLPMIDLEAMIPKSPTDFFEDPAETKISQASQLVTFSTENNDLFHDENKYAYAQNKSTGETRRLDGRQFKNWLIASFYELHQLSPREQSVREALCTLSSLALYKGACRPVFTRVAQQGNCYYLDLGESGNSRAIEIKAGGWRIINHPPVLFLRSENLLSLPEPEKDGDLSLLWKLINIPEDMQLIVTAWLAECLRPNTPFPILELFGEQGSAKSTTQTLLRRLIDPNASNLRAAPKKIEDVFVGAGVNWFCSYENISYLSPPMQDALCILSTGGGFAKRKLYSDDEESVIHVKRPIVLNGISTAITANDLVDRAISIEMLNIQDRCEITQLLESYDKHHGSILGGLLNVTVDALAKLPTIDRTIANQSRLIEFLRFGIAISYAMGKEVGDFLTPFNTNRKESFTRALEASPIGIALVHWFKDQQQKKCVITVKKLSEELERYADKWRNSEAWPRTYRKFGDELRRIAPALRQVGIECRSLARQGGYVKYLIRSLDDAEEGGKT